MVNDPGGLFNPASLTTKFIPTSLQDAIYQRNFVIFHNFTATQSLDTMLTNDMLTVLFLVFHHPTYTNVCLQVMRSFLALIVVSAANG